MSFDLDRATLHDITILAEIFRDAFAADTHTQIKLVGKGPDSMVEGMKGAISSWIQNYDRCVVTKAVEKSSNRIMGWVCWGYQGYKEPVSGLTHKEEQQSSKREEGKKEEENNESADVPKEQAKELDKVGIEQMESIEEADKERWIKGTMSEDSQCMYIVCISVHPEFQSRGVGSALIRKGTEQADTNQVFCWVHASEAGYRSFEKFGFIVDESLEIDLDQFAPAPPEEGGSWGLYTLRYMIRLPSR